MIQPVKDIHESRTRNRRTFNGVRSHDSSGGTKRHAIIFGMALKQTRLLGERVVCHAAIRADPSSSWIYQRDADTLYFEDEDNVVVIRMSDARPTVLGVRSGPRTVS